IERYKRFYPWLSDADRARVEPRPAWLSPEWSELVAYTKRTADSLGLGCDFTFGTAWPFGDSQVAPADATKVFGKPDFKQENIISWEYPLKGLILDHLNAPAFQRYADRMGRALEPATRTGAPSALFCDSWEVETDQLWTDGFGDAFTAKYGYDLAPYM